MNRSPGPLAVLLLLVLACWATPAAAQTAPDPNEIDLEQRLYQYRDDHRIPASRNVAVFEFEYPDGRRGTIAIDSERHSKAGEAGDRIQGHSERRAARILLRYGIQPSWVTRILSELQPCSLPGAYCARMLSREFPQAKVEWFYEYGDSKESRQRGNAAKRAVVTEHYARRDAAQQTLRVPGAKPPSGPLMDALARPGIRPGGIDFSSLELRYVSDAGPQGGGISYSLAGRPTDGPSDPAAGLAAAKRSSDAFFAWLTLPPQSFWVNLLPDEPHNIIDPQFARTDAGHVLLEADYRLKRVLAPLTDPKTPTGAEFWRRIDALYGGDQLKANACITSRVWIEPAPATVRETADELHIIDAPLTVQMDLLPPDRGRHTCAPEDPSMAPAKLQVFRDVVVPSMVHTVNTAPEFAELRRVYLSRVAAEWVRARADRSTPLGKLVDSGAIDPWVADPAWNPMDIFNAYMTSYAGDYSYERTVEVGGQTYTLTYVTGGVDFSRTQRRNVSRDEFRTRWGDRAKRAREAVERPAASPDGQVWLGAGERGVTQPRIRNELGTRQRPGALRMRASASARRARPGDTVRLALQVRNRGDARLDGVEVCDRLPRGLVFVRANRAHRMRDGHHCWDVGRLGAGRSATIRVTARVTAGARGTLRNRATATVAGQPALGVRARQALRVAGAAQTAPAGGVTG